MSLDYLPLDDIHLDDRPIKLPLDEIPLEKPLDIPIDAMPFDIPLDNTFDVPLDDMPLMTFPLIYPLMICP